MSGDVAPRWSMLRIRREDLGELKLFDKGGEGTLYRAPRFVGPFGQPVLYKEYRPGHGEIDEEVLEQFARFARSLDSPTLAWMYQRTAWPAWIVDDTQNGRREPVGVLIPVVAPGFMVELTRSTGGTRIVPAKFELLLNGSDFLESVGIDISVRQRIQLLKMVAETMAFLHAHSIAVGDFSCKNMLFGLEPHPSCFVIDCDSMSWGGRTALPPGETRSGSSPQGST